MQCAGAEIGLAQLGHAEVISPLARSAALSAFHKFSRASRSAVLVSAFASLAHGLVLPLFEPAPGSHAKTQLRKRAGQYLSPCTRVPFCRREPIREECDPVHGKRFQVRRPE